jgi:hypothetical protein
MSTRTRADSWKYTTVREIPRRRSRPKPIPWNDFVARLDRMGYGDDLRELLRLKCVLRARHRQTYARLDAIMSRSDHRPRRPSPSPAELLEQARQETWGIDPYTLARYRSGYHRGRSR